MNEDQTFLHFMKMSCVALRKLEWKQDIEEVAHFCRQCLEQVTVFLISKVLSNQMTGKVFFVALETSSCIYLRIISLNHPHLQLVTPL